MTILGKEVFVFAISKRVKIVDGSLFTHRFQGLRGNVQYFRNLIKHFDDRNFASDGIEVGRHFKTDNAKLFEWSLPEMESCYLELHNLTRDLHANGPVGIMTGYEEKFYALGTPINRVEAVVVTKQPRPADEKGEGEENNTPTDDGKEQE